jgi:ElaA protein
MTTDRPSSKAIDWQWRTLAALTAPELYAVMAARQAVFVVEQTCAYQDADGLDNDAQHLIGWDGNVVAAYLRIVQPGMKFVEPSIGRVLTARTHRGSGVGRQAMLLAMDHVVRHFPGQSVRISAQAHLERFYGDFGFVKVSETYLEDGIPHIEMLRRALG